MADPLDRAELEALAIIMREQRVDPAQVDSSAMRSAIHEHFRTVRYHLDPKLGPLRSAWAKLAGEEPLPETPMLKLGPHRPKRRR